ncbi:MAG: DUF5615 family PIN-like protein [Chloroflexota bacterium]
MLLLLDAQFSQRVSRPLRASGIDSFTMEEWHGGEYRHKEDEEILEAAAAEGRTLVTYDEATIADLLRAWGMEGRSHAGIIFVKNQSIRQEDFGGQIRALRALVEERGDEVWRDLVVYLRPA